ncbi:MAG: leucyl aminopeptidase [Pseudomonadota bacterium]
MEYAAKSGSPEKQRVACVIVGVFEHRRLSDAAETLDKASGGVLGGILRRGDMDGKPEQTLLLHNLPNTLCDRVLLVGCGKEREFDDARYRQASRAALRALRRSGARDLTTYLTELPVRGRDLGWKVRETVVACEELRYRFHAPKEEDGPDTRLRNLTVGVESRRDLDEAEATLLTAQATTAGTLLARHLGNLPPNVCTPSYLADQALALAADDPAITAQILETADMEALGMGALLSVARGSRQPPKLIVLEYGADINKTRPVVLVGKGVTFDSGGISLKPGAAMDEMKFDMCGAASVLGTFKAVSQLKLPIHLVGIIPSSENLPDGNASKPGDIVTSMSGKTIEILNTDAEGRLLLCDALTYAKRYEPQVIIDIATLTGACVIALGSHASGLFSNDPALAKALLAAGEVTGDRAWQMPLWPEYQKQLDSNFADMANIGGREAGSVTAACFLWRFVEDQRWAHLDIAGTAWKSGKDKGATGRPVPLLVEYLRQQVA